MARSILTASSVLLVLVGVGCLFFPEESAAALSLPVGAAEVLPLIGGGQLGLAVMNWMGRGAIYGGVYGRPIVLGNFSNGMITGSAMLRVQLDTGSALGWVVLGALALYLIAFTRLAFWRPFEGDRRRQAA